MKKTNMARLFVVLLLFCSMAAAGQVVSFEFYVHESGTVEMRNIAVVDGEPTRFFDEAGEYSVQLYDVQGRELGAMARNLDFWILSDPPHKTNKTAFTGSLRYFDSVESLVMKKNGTEIYRYEFPKERECTRDGICSTGENPVFCPSDCKAEEKKEAPCVQKWDGKCDMRCEAGTLDCMAIATSGFGKLAGICILGLVVFGAVGMGAYLLMRRKVRKRV